MASKRRLRARACERKRAYETPQEAFRAAAWANRHTMYVQAYRCQFCRKYHVGHYRQPWNYPHKSHHQRGI